MSAEGSEPFKGGRPSDPPRKSFGPEITPPDSSGPAEPGEGGGKRFCANCGKEWPAETKFCTGCGTWMEGGPAKSSFKEHIDRQVQERQDAMMPSFVKEGPPEKKKKGKSPIFTVLVLVLFAVVIVGAAGYAFFKGPAYLMIGNLMRWMGKYDTAAGWYNNVREVYRTGTWFDKATANMDTATLALYGEYMDAMRFKNYIATVEVKNGGKRKWKVYHSSSGDLRIEMYRPGTGGQEAVAKLIIETKGKRHPYDYVLRSHRPVSLNEYELKIRKKSGRERILKDFKEFGRVHIMEETESAGKKKCFVIDARWKGDKKDQLLLALGLQKNYPGVCDAQSVKVYIGVEDKLLYRMVVGGADDDKLVTYDYTKIDIGAKIPKDAFSTAPVVRQLK